MPRPSGHPLKAPSYGIQTEKTTTRRGGHDHRTIDDGVCTCTDISRKQSSSICVPHAMCSVSSVDPTIKLNDGIQKYECR